MIELNGKYNSAKVFTDNIDNETISQVIQLLNQPFVSDNKIRIMPDCHAGSGCVIGTTMTLTDKVVPNLVGVDIGCFTGDTEVWCSGGFYKPIKELAEKNEKFMTDAWDEKQHHFVSAVANAFKTRTNAELVQVTYKKESFNNQESEVSIRCTPDHKFLTCYENSHKPYYCNDTFVWKEAKDLREGTRLWAENLVVSVVKVEKLEETEDVYCLNVPEYHNFSIKYGVIVHNCGMLAIKLKEKSMDLSLLDECIKQYIPSGFNIHERVIAKSNIDKILAPIDKDKAYKSLGTLGGGNHFIEVDKDKDNNLWLVIHTGSRHLGIEVCKHYQDLAWHTIKNRGIENKIKETVERLKAEGKLHEIENTIKILRMQAGTIPKDLCYIEGDVFHRYINDMKYTQEHAKINRETIAKEILVHMDLHEIERFDTIHNYIDVENFILRKGSISAQKGERVIIPMNMRDGSLICIGKGNPDWNYSAPHGAGRIMSRSEAKENVNFDDFVKSMNGIYSTSVVESTIDESPMVYKPIEEIMKNIKDTVNIIDIIKPIYNFKAH